MKFTDFIKNIFKVGCIGFGGGSALVPILEDVLIKNASLDTSNNFDKDVIVANLTPGALPVEIAGSLGRRNFGLKGLLCGSTAMALPGAIATILILCLLSDVKAESLIYIKMLSVGISAYIICQLVHYILTFFRGAKKESNHRFFSSLAIFAGVCLLMCENNLYKLIGTTATPIFAVSTIVVLLTVFFHIFFTYGKSNRLLCNTVSALLCLLFVLGHGKTGLLKDTAVLYCVEVCMAIMALSGLIKQYLCLKGKIQFDHQSLKLDLTALIIYALFFSIPAAFSSFSSWFEFFGRGVLSSWMSFGGGDAYLTIADGLFVETGLVSSTIFYGSIIAIVNVLPGSILCKTLAGLGYFIGFSVSGSIVTALMFAISGFAFSVAASCACFELAYYFYDSMSNTNLFREINRWIRPVICGLLINVMLSLIKSNMTLSSMISAVSNQKILYFTLVLSALNIYFFEKAKLKNIAIIIIDMIAAGIFGFLQLSCFSA